MDSRQPTVHGKELPENDPLGEALSAIPLSRIFAAFLRLGATSFGGGTAGWLYREIVLRRGWIGERAFLPMLAIAQVIPGSNGVNLTVLIGQRLRRSAGAAAALLGLLGAPFAIVLVLGSLYAGLAGYKLLHQMLDGAAAAVVGMTFAVGLRSVAKGTPGAIPVAVTTVTVICVGVMRWPLLPVIAVLMPLSIALAAALPARR